MLTGQDFAEYYAAQADRLRNWARLRLAQRYNRADAAGEAEDVTEDVWAAVWEHWRAFDAVPHPSYLYAAASRRMIDQLRRRKLIAWHSLDAVPSALERGGEPGAWLIDGRDRIAQLETRLDLAAALGLLTATERQAFVSFYVRDQSTAGRADNQAEKMRRMRARQRLQRCEPLALYAPIPIAS